MNGVGNGIAVAIEALQGDFDVIDVLSHATIEAARPRGVVDAGVCCHGGQAQGSAQADVVKGHLVNAIFHRAKASLRSVSGSVHLVRQLLHQRLQPIELGVAICSNHKAMAVSSKMS
jgi:hypothetical protein